MADNWFKSEFDSSEATAPKSVSSTNNPGDLKESKQPKRKSQNSSSNKRKSEERAGIPVRVNNENDCKKPKLSKQINWLTEFEPETVSELAVHPKKIEDLGNWFKTCTVKVSNKILVVEGPTGCGKSSALKLLAKENDYKIIEWINKIDKDFDSDSRKENYFHFDNFRNQVDEFENFLLKSSNYSSVFGRKDRKILLVKDMPTVFLKKTDEFLRILRKFSEEGNCPLIFILTDTSSKSLNISFNLFTEKVRSELKIDTISLNPISITLMKRGIKRIFQLLEMRGMDGFEPPENVIENIIESSSGDIRNAILNLNIASQRSAIEIVTVGKQPKNKSKKTIKSRKPKKDEKKALNEASNSLGKNEILSLMHGVGRVMHPKMEINEEKGRLQLTHRPEDIAEIFASQPKNFMEMIHSNYIKNFSKIENVAAAANNFSVSDMLSFEYRDPTLTLVNLDFVIRSTMISNEAPASGFRTVSSYASKKFRSIEATSQDKLKESSHQFNNGNLLVRKDFFCDYNCYSNIILKK